MMKVASDFNSPPGFDKYWNHFYQILFLQWMFQSKEAKIAAGLFLEHRFKQKDVGGVCWRIKHWRSGLWGASGLWSERENSWTDSRAVNTGRMFVFLSSLPCRDPMSFIRFLLVSAHQQDNFSFLLKSDFTRTWIKHESDLFQQEKTWRPGWLSWKRSWLKVPISPVQNWGRPGHSGSRRLHFLSYHHKRNTGWVCNSAEFWSDDISAAESEKQDKYAENSWAMLPGTAEDLWCWGIINMLSRHLLHFKQLDLNLLTI